MTLMVLDSLMVDLKKGGGITGIIKTNSALVRWALSYKASIARKTRKQLMADHHDNMIHNESTSSTIVRDNSDE